MQHVMGSIKVKVRKTTTQQKEFFSCFMVLSNWYEH